MPDSSAVNVPSIEGATNLSVAAAPGSYRMVEACRACKGTQLVKFLSLGDQPHCNGFLRRDQLGAFEPRWPLNLLYCKDCDLVQLDCVVDPEVMFRNYPYVSGTTRTLAAHFQQCARTLSQRFGLRANDLVVDIGSNDGTFLDAFGRCGLRVLGVDPARNVAEIARRRGIETVTDFFGQHVARSIAQTRGRASLICAAGVFFHIDDMDDVCRGICELLADRGVLHIQAIYLGDLLEHTSFDNVYHEHLSYYTFGPLRRMLLRFGLDTFEVEHSPIHGGSLLVYACKAGAYPIGSSVAKLLDYEHCKGWDTLSPYLELGGRVQEVRNELLSMLHMLKARGKRIAAYGAPAKGNTMLNYCEVDGSLLEYAAEVAPLKVNLFTPGSHIPIIDEKHAMKDPPDYFLLLPWNFEQELLEKNRAYRERGGRFIIPIPRPHLV